jgi:hypothetical protein
MRVVAWQAAVVCLLVARVRAEPVGRYARQLADECDALIEVAVKRPYGWAWPATLESARANARQVQVSMESGATPAAGLVLLEASDVLKDARYAAAAVNAARAVAASQQATGKILAGPTFGNSAGGRDAASAVPDRAATRAGLALLIAARGVDSSKDAQLAGAARRAIAWLLKQQAHDGGWPTAYPPDADPLDAERLIRLDGSHYRDSTLALFLAADALDDKPAGKAAARAVGKLLALKVNAPKRLAGTWTSVYQMNGQFDEKHLAEFPPGADILATRYATQTLLSAFVLTRDAEAHAAIDTVATSLAGLRDERADGSWKRLYPFEARGSNFPATTQSVFGPTTTTTAPSIDIEAAGTFGLDQLLDSIRQLQQLGGDEYETRLRSQIPPREQLALTVAGLWDQPMSCDWPATREQAQAYLERHQDLLKRLEGAPPADLKARTARLQALVLRARLEAQFPDLDP